MEEPNPSLMEAARVMVATQIRARGVGDEAVLRAMEAVPRHRFLPEGLRAHAYEDRPLPIGEGQTISQPYMVARMTELLQVRPGAKVLEVGTGSGYQAAVLAQLGALVHTIERLPALHEDKAPLFSELGCASVCTHLGDGTLGLPELAPFDGIIVTAGAPGVPRRLKEQLAVGARLVIPTGPQGMQRLECYTRTTTGYDLLQDTYCGFVPLIGEDGW